MFVRLSTNDLCKLLDINRNELNRICKLGELDNALKFMNYELKDKYNEGEKIIYKLEPYDKKEWMELQKAYSESCMRKAKRNKKVK